MIKGNDLMTDEEKMITDELKAAAEETAGEAAEAAEEAAAETVEAAEEAVGEAAEATEETAAEAVETAEEAAGEAAEAAEGTAAEAVETAEEAAGEAAEAAEGAAAAAEEAGATEVVKDHESRKQTKKPIARKIILTVLAVLAILVAGGIAIVNHYLNRIEKIDNSTQTTLSPEDFLTLIGIDSTEAEASTSLENDTEPTETATEAISTEETQTETETESESVQTLAEEETERIIMIDPDETNVVVIEESTKATVPYVAPTAPPQTTAYVPPVSYDYVKAASLNDEGLINIILVGDDSRGSGSSRSDVIMLLSMNPNSHRISLISFMRDMYLPIQGGYSSRINHAYEAGGFPLLYQCLNNNFGLHIDGGVRLDFTGFSKAVDALGGVDISLTAAEANAMKGYLKTYSGKTTDPSTIHEGYCHLDGNAALAYCRIRKIDSDFSRTARQRKMLTVLFNKFKSPGAMNTVLNTVLSYCATDMGNGTIMSYAGQVIGSIGSYSFNTYRLPADGTYRAVNIRGMDVLQSIQSRNISALKSYLPY